MTSVRTIAVVAVLPWVQTKAPAGTVLCVFSVAGVPTVYVDTGWTGAQDIYVSTLETIPGPVGAEYVGSCQAPAGDLGPGSVSHVWRIPDRQATQ